MGVFILIFREYLYHLCSMCAVRTTLHSFADFYVLHITALTRARRGNHFSMGVVSLAVQKQKSAVQEHQLSFN